MAWLWSASNRMEEDAEKVSAFLTKHGLDRYAMLLADEPSGLGASLETLSQADDSLLEKAGLPASPRARLLLALQSETEAPAALASESSCPRSSASDPRHQESTQSSRPSSRGWLGRPPPGWSMVAPGLSTLSTRVVQTSDACTGEGGSSSSTGGVQDGAAAASESTPLPTPPLSSPTDARRRPTPLSQGQPSPLVQASRPSTAEAGVAAEVSRPGTSSGTTERVSCYQCYKQILSRNATNLQDPLCEATPRQFCGEACVQLFQRTMEQRRQRERQLHELRASLEGVEADTEDAS